MDVRRLMRDDWNQTRSLDSLLELIERLDRRVRQLEAENTRLRERLRKDEPEILKSPAMNRRIVTWNPSGAQNPSARYAFAYFAVTLEQIQAHALETGQGR